MENKSNLDMLLTEVGVLIRCSEQHQMSVTPIVKQLIQDYLRPNGDDPPKLDIVRFKWPASGNVVLEDFWRNQDNAK